MLTMRLDESVAGLALAGPDAAGPDRTKPDEAKAGIRESRALALYWGLRPRDPVENLGGEAWEELHLAEFQTELERA